MECPGKLKHQLFRGCILIYWIKKQMIDHQHVVPYLKELLDGDSFMNLMECNRMLYQMGCACIRHLRPVRQIKDRDLSRLLMSRGNGLVSLDLSECSFVTDLSCLPNSLVKLDLSDCTKIGDQGMVHVGRLVGLEELVMKKDLLIETCDNVSDIGFGQLADLVNLQVLVLEMTDCTGQIMETLNRLTSLRVLELPNVDDFNGELRVDLGKFVVGGNFSGQLLCSTASLSLSCWRMDVKKFAFLKDLVGLRQLKLLGCFELNNAIIPHLLCLTNLEDLLIDGGTFTRYWIEQLASLSRLVSLELNDLIDLREALDLSQFRGLRRLKASTNIDTGSMAGLVELESVDLMLHNSPIDLVPLAGCNRLVEMKICMVDGRPCDLLLPRNMGVQTFEISNVNVTDDNIDCLVSWDMRKLSLIHCELTDHMVERILDTHIGLESLDLCNPPISEYVMSKIGRLYNLKELSLNIYDWVTDDTLVAIGVLPNLEKVNLMDMRNVTDRSLGLLANYYSLTHLNLYNTSVTVDGLEQLAGLPNLRSLRGHMIDNWDIMNRLLDKHHHLMFQVGGMDDPDFDSDDDI